MNELEYQIEVPMRGKKTKLLTTISRVGENKWTVIYRDQQIAELEKLTNYSHDVWTIKNTQLKFSSQQAALEYLLRPDGELYSG